jgi:hypothetical protein
MADDLFAQAFGSPASQSGGSSDPFSDVFGPKAADTQAAQDAFRTISPAGHFADSMDTTGVVSAPDSVPLADRAQQYQDQQDSWADTGRKFVSHIIPGLEHWAGGLREQRRKTSHTAMGMTADSVVSMQRHRQEEVAKERLAGAVPGQKMAAAATKDLADNAYNPGDSTTKKYAGMIADGVVKMLPAMAAGLLTRNPEVGAAGFFAQAAGDQYAESRDKGRDPQQANMDSLFMGAANSIAPELPLRVIMKPGGSFLMHTMRAAGAGAVGNMFSTVLQEGYDAGVLKEDMTWGEAIQRVKEAGIVGGLVGGVLGAATYRKPPPTPGTDVGAAGDPFGDIFGPKDSPNPPSPDREYVTDDFGMPREFANHREAALYAAANKLGGDHEFEVAGGGKVRLVRRPLAGEPADAVPDDTVLTPEDRASPIPDAIIAKGRKAAGGIMAPEGAIPTAEDASAIIDHFIGKTGSVESGNNPNAANPDSSAVGTHQFLKGTWLSLVKSARPDLAEGKTDDQLLALRGNPLISAQMAAIYARQNADYLQKNGHQVDEGSLYLSHFLGAGGADALLSASPNQPIATVLPKNVIDANGSILKGKTAGDVVAWAYGKMGAQPGPISDQIGNMAPTTDQQIEGVQAFITRVLGDEHGNGGDVTLAQANDPADIAGQEIGVAPNGADAGGGLSGISAIEPGSAVVPDAAATPAQPITFTTAKGSTYTVEANGATTRNKAYRPEHGEAEQGIQPTSEHTFYLAPGDAEKLSLMQARGGIGRMRVVIEGQHAAIQYADGPEARKIIKGTIVPIQTAPRMGATPVELWNGGQNIHFGNEITKISREDANGEGESRPIEASALLDMGGDKSALLQPKSSSVSKLRGAGDSDVSGMGSEFSGVSGGRGKEAEPNPHLGQEEQREPLRAGKRALAHEGAASEEQAGQLRSEVQGKIHDANGLGEENRVGSIDTALPVGSGRDVGRASPDDRQARGEKAGRTVSDKGGYLAPTRAAPRPRADPNGVDLVTFIADHGGLSDDDGNDLRGRGRLIRGVVSGQKERAGGGGARLPRLAPGGGQVFRKSGMSIDQLGELLHESGWVTGERPTTADVLDLLDRTAEGRVFHPERVAEKADEARTAALEEQHGTEEQARASVTEIAREIGVPIKASEIDEIIALMAEDNLDARGAVERYFEVDTMNALDEALKQAQDSGYDIDYDPFSDEAQADRDRGESGGRPAPVEAAAQPAGPERESHEGAGQEVAPRVETFEAFAARHDASRQGYGDAGLHKMGHASPAAKRRELNRSANEAADLAARREELQKQYDEAVARGEIREPTYREQIEAAAAGNPDRKDTQAAQALLKKKGWDKPVGTAPEHVNLKPTDELPKPYEPVAKGVQPTLFADPEHPEIEAVDLTEREFRQITDEWADLFADPQDTMRIAKKAKVETELSPEEAKTRIAAWKERVKAQAATLRGANSDKTVLSLFDLTGEWSKPWREAGYNVIQFDIQHDPDLGDIHNFNVDFFNENFDISDVYAILAACPCTDFAASGARHFAGKDKDGRTAASIELVKQTLRTIEYFRPAVWALENPVGRIERLTGLPKARMTFDPNHFGDPYTKKTILWGRFNADLEVAPVAPTEGSMMWKKYGGKSQATKNARSATPEGFAYSFFLANNYADMPVEQKLTTQYPEASGAVSAALKAGVTEPEIHDLMEHTYGDYDYEAAREALKKAALEKQGRESKRFQRA